MIFSSLPYIFFLLMVVLLYWKVAGRFRVPLLLVASYVFYMAWNPPMGLLYGPMIFADSAWVYALSRLMERWPAQKKELLWIGVGSQLGLLGYFKYAQFFAESATELLKTLHLPTAPLHFEIVLPLAISFTTFILIGYLIDVYRGQETPYRSFVRFATYIAFFPHLIAGPIVRASELLRQFDTLPEFRWENVARGVHRFCNGFFLKVFIADVIAVYVDMIYGNPSLQAFNTGWVATYAFSIQMFCDFFGYTLMAQGSALMLGYTLPDNFDAPYFAKNMSEFWRRWHMSLSRWLKDYLYIPLGGSRGTKLQTYRNLFITMGLGGLWHGANWTFVAWGLFQGAMLCLQKWAQSLGITRYIPTLAAIVITFHGVCLGRVLFRSHSLTEAFHMYQAMLNPLVWKHVGIAEQTVEGGLSFMSTETALLMVLLFLAGHAAIRTFRPEMLRVRPLFRDAAVGLAYATFLYCLCTLGGTSSQQFIYFEF